MQEEARAHDGGAGTGAHRESERDADGFSRLFGLPMRAKAQDDLNRVVRAAPMDPAPGDKRD